MDLDCLMFQKTVKNMSLLLCSKTVTRKVFVPRRLCKVSINSKKSGLRFHRGLSFSNESQ